MDEAEPGRRAIDLAKQRDVELLRLSMMGEIAVVRTEMWKHLVYVAFAVQALTIGIAIVWMLR